jgi:hypothetical protein
VSTASAMLVCVTPPTLVTRVRRSSIFVRVHLVVSVCPLIEVETPPLLTMVDSRHYALTLTSPGAMGTMAVTGSHGRSR